MTTSPFWIIGPWQGRLGILPRPRGGDWLGDEVRSWKVAGIDVVVSLLEGEEIAELNLTQEAELSRQIGLNYIEAPIPDRGVPASFRATVELAQQLASLLTEGKSVAMHCRQGVGRSALLAACLLVVAGLDVDTAWDRVKKARGCPVPDTDEQREWVGRFARSLPARVSD